MKMATITKGKHKGRQVSDVARERKKRLEQSTTHPKAKKKKPPKKDTPVPGGVKWR
jgi:hypothetical protein